MTYILSILLTAATILFTACGTAPVETAPAVSLEDLPSYVVVRPERTSDTLIAASADLYKLFREISTSIVFKDDYLSARDPDPVPDLEILIGSTNRPESAAFIESLAPDEYGYTLAGRKILIAGTSDLHTVRAVALFAENILSRTPENGIFYSAADNLTVTDSRSADALTAMSFNILCNPMEKPRTERVCRMIADYLPDTFGVQEATPAWMKLLNREFGELYACVGEGRDGGDSGEYSAIFYKKDTFTLLDSGTKWLSDTPDTVSKVEESSLNRIFTYALLERTADSTPLMVVNTHFDHTSDTARERQAGVLADFLADYTSVYPVVLTGDFNTTPHTPAYEEILDAGVADASDIAETASEAMTFTNFGATGKMIDFIFVTDSRILVREYRVCNEKIDGEYPSDHHPILIEYVPVG